MRSRTLAKEFSVYRKRRYIICSLVALPLTLPLLMPMSILLSARTRAISRREEMLTKWK